MMFRAPMKRLPLWGGVVGAMSFVVACLSGVYPLSSPLNDMLFHKARDIPWDHFAIHSSIQDNKHTT
jgi:hypothetical protein